MNINIKDGLWEMLSKVTKIVVILHENAGIKKIIQESCIRCESFMSS